MGNNYFYFSQTQIILLNEEKKREKRNNQIGNGWRLAGYAWLDHVLVGNFSRMDWRMCRAASLMPGVV